MASNKFGYSFLSVIIKGSVYLFMDKTTGEKIVIKAFTEDDSFEREIDELALNEMNILKRLKHKNIVKYIDDSDGKDRGKVIALDPKGTGHFLRSKIPAYIAMEYCENGDLSRIIKEVKNKKSRFREDAILKWVYQATDALAYLHSKKLMHRDIKPTNMLLSKEEEIKLCDFSLACYVEEQEQEAEFAGTVAYMSPEIWKVQNGDFIKCYLNSDIWSLGCVLYELVYLMLAFPRGQRVDPPLPDLRDSGQFSTILRMMLEKDPEKRITSEDLLALLNSKNNMTRNEEQRKKEEKENRELKKELERLKEERDKKSQNEEELRKELEKLKMEKEMETKKLREQHEIEKSAILKKEELNKDSFKRYEKLKFLKAGGYGEVYLVRDKKINVKKAMKMLEKTDETAENEFFTYLQVNHENIVKYFDHFDHYEEENSTDYICIITEYCENLRRIINKAKKDKTKLAEAQILEWITQATNGLKYLHNNSIIHRDIKPENILLTKDYMIKLVDLGVAKYLSKTTIGRTYRGTKQYMSPEQNRGRHYEDDEIYETHSYSTDIWSLGCVLYELIRLEFAFPDGQSSNPNIPRLTDLGCFSGILSRMLVIDPKNRISSKKLYIDLGYSISRR